MIYPDFDPRLPVVAVDFDGVLASSHWPSPRIGEPDFNALYLVEHYHSLGCEVIVFTARPVSHHPRIWAWLEKHGIDWAIYDVTREKPVASVYIDDRAHPWPLSRDTEIAWAAGFFDGEGCTTMLRDKRRGHAAVRLSIAQKDIRALARFRTAIGTERKINPPNKTGVHYLHINSQPEATRVLDLLWPYLGPAKREQAERCLDESTWHNGHADQLKCRDATHNVVPRKSGGRACLTCYNARKAERAAAKAVRWPLA